MRNALSMSGTRRNGSVNLDDSTETGSLDSVLEKEQSRRVCMITLTVSVTFDCPRKWCDISEMVLRR